MSDDEHSGSEDESSPTEAELAFKKRREGQTSAHGLDEAERELLETNKQDRLRMEQEIQELRKRNEKRKKEREIEEKRLAAERAAEDERRKAAEEAKKKQKEEEELKKQKERAKKLAEFDKLKNADKPNFVISKRGGSVGDEEVVEVKEGGKKSREQLEAEKRAIMKQRIVPLQIDGLEQSGLADKAKELHKLLYRLESEKYDLEKRFKSQQVDMMELAERARQANKVGRGGLKRTKLEDGESDVIQERYAGTPGKVEMFSKYERSKDKRGYHDKKNVFTGPQYILPSDRIKPEKIVKWSPEGLPRYEEISEGAGHGHAEEE
jgi:troponin T